MYPFLIVSPRVAPSLVLQYTYIFSTAIVKNEHILYLGSRSVVPQLCTMPTHEGSRACSSHVGLRRSEIYWGSAFRLFLVWLLLAFPTFFSCSTRSRLRFLSSKNTNWLRYIRTLRSTRPSSNIVISCTEIGVS